MEQRDLFDNISSIDIWPKKPITTVTVRNTSSKVEAALSWKWNIEEVKIETCPNCGKDLYNWKCQDMQECWYGWWDDYLAQKDKESQEKSEKMRWNGQHISMKTYAWKEFIYVYYRNRLDRWKKQITAKVKYDWKVFEIFASYSIQEHTNYTDGETTRNLSVTILKHPHIKDTNSKIISIAKGKKRKWFLDYILAEEIIEKILVERFRIYQ